MHRDPATAHPASAVVRPRSAQRGAALVVALILLVVITLVGLAAIGTTILQNKAAANEYDRQVAFQAAEAALRQAQVAIAAATLPAPAGFEDCSTADGSSTPVNVCLADPFKDTGVPTAQIATVPASAYSAGPVVAAPPQYVVQYLGLFVAPPSKTQLTSNRQSYGAVPGERKADYYRITARSGDPSLVKGRSIVTLQSTYRK